MNNFCYYSPTKYVFGKGEENNIGSYLQAYAPKKAVSYTHLILGMSLWTILWNIYGQDTDCLALIKEGLFLEDFTLLWQQVCLDLKEDLSDFSFHTWVEPLRAVALENDRLILCLLYTSYHRVLRETSKCNKKIDFLPVENFHSNFIGGFFRNARL